MSDITEFCLKPVVSVNATDYESPKDIPLNTNKTYTCGRSREKDISCPSTLVSRQHCILFRNEANLYIQDLRSSNGTFINGKKQKPNVMVPLKEGDIIGIGYNGLEPNDSDQCVYRLHKQVIIDLEQECVKTEREYFYLEEENHQTPSKLVKVSENSSHIAVQNLGNSILRHKTPSTVSEPIYSATSVHMSFEVSVNNGHTGPMPNVFVNQIPIALSSNRFQILRESDITENQASQLGRIQNSFEAPNSCTSVNAIPHNAAVFQELENVGVSDDNVTSSSTAFSDNKHIKAENSSFKITKISRRKSFPAINAIGGESSSSEKELCATPISAEEPKEAAQVLLQKIKPDSTVNDTDSSDTSNALCTSTTKTSRNNTSLEKRNKDVASDLKYNKKRTLTVVQKTASGKRRETLRHMGINSNSKEIKDTSEVKDLRTSANKKRENRRQDSKLKTLEDEKIKTNGKKDSKLENSDQIAEENDSDESDNLVNDTDCSNTFSALCISTTKISRSNTSLENLNKDVASDLKSKKTRTLTVVQKTESGNRREALRYIDINSNSKEIKDTSEVKDLRTSANKKRENRRQDSKLKTLEDQKIRTNGKKDSKLENSYQIAEESDSEESIKLHFSDEGEEEVYENSNLNISSAKINVLQRTNDPFIENAIVKELEPLKSPEVPLKGLVDPRTCKLTSQSKCQEINSSNNIESNQVAWKKASNAISSFNNTSNQNVPFTFNPNPFPNAQYPCPIYLNSYSSPQDLYPNYYEMSYSNFQLPYYQLPDHPIICQNHQTSHLNYPPPYASDQISYPVGQTPLPVPYPYRETSQSNNNQSPCLYSNDLSVANSSSAANASEGKANTLEEFSASWHYKGVEETYRAERIELKIKKATPKVIRSEIVKLPYKFSLKSLLHMNNDLRSNKGLLQETTPKSMPYCIQKHPEIESLPLDSLKLQVSPEDKNLKSFVPQPAAKLGPLHISSSGSKLRNVCNNLNNSAMLVQESVKKFQRDIRKVSGMFVPEDKLFRSVLKFNEVLVNIVFWKPAEFESCFSKEVPSFIKPEKLRKTPLVYRNHDDYCKVQIPLILVNMSYMIKNAYKVIKKRTKFTNCEIVKGSASAIWVADTDKYMMEFNIKVCGSKINLPKPPVIGDFLRMEIKNCDTNFRTLMFAYVAKIFVDRKENECDSESFSITFAVVTKSIDFNIYRSKIKELSLIISLLPSMNLVTALENIKGSALLPLILNPDPEDYQLATGSHMNPDLKVLLDTSSTPALLAEDNLNYNQLSAVRKIANVAIRREPKVVLIEGSPGTGKTKVITDTIIEILNGQKYNQEKNHTMKILVCGESDSIVDEILHRVHDKKKHLQKTTLKMVRVGLVDKMSSRAKVSSLRELAKKHVELRFKYWATRDLSTPLDQELKQLDDQINATKEEIENKNNRNAVEKLALLTTYLDIKRSGRNVTNIDPDEYADLFEVVEHTILLGANVIVCTLDMCYSPTMNLAFRVENLIPVLIVEEATQSLETDILKPLTFGIQTLILVGDACKRSAKCLEFPILETHGFAKSLFSRLRSKLEDAVHCPIFKLHIQYRMNKQIAYFPNKFFHGNKVLNSVTSGNTFPLCSYRIFNVHLDTSDKLEECELNFATSLLVCIILHSGLNNTSKPLKIGVITTSKNSSVRIRRALEDQLEICLATKRNLVSIEVDTIQKFTNQERDVICAFCHKPKDGQRLVDSQRLYSVMTIAKHSLILYGEFRKFDDETMSLWNCLIEDARARNILYDIESHPHRSKLKTLLIGC